MPLYAFDGTWNEEKKGDDNAFHNTNVVRFYRTYTANSGKHDFYVAGVGTRYDLLGKVFGGAFGLGQPARLEEAYRALCKNWLAGDTDIDVIGFSRGAATALDFCTIIQKNGIKDPDGKVIQKDPLIRFLGVWDIVDAFGFGFLGVHDFNFGHCLSLPKANLKYAFHALALDERRPSFLPTRMDGACEVWFRGVHSDIGGGNGNRGLNDIALKWMFAKAKAADLPITQNDIDLLQPDPKTEPNLDKKKLLIPIRNVSDTDRCHYTVSPIEGCENPAATCPIEDTAAEGLAIPIVERISVLSLDVRNRMGSIVAAALKTSDQLGVSLAGTHDALWSLVEHRIVLVTNDAELKQAETAMARLIAETTRLAKEKGFVGVVNEFFFNQALKNLSPLFPFVR